MIDNKAGKAFKEWNLKKTDQCFLRECMEKYGLGTNHHYRPFIFISGYAARDKEAEEEKRELIEVMIYCYKLEKEANDTFEQYSGYANVIGRNKEHKLKIAIEKHTGKTIEEILQGD